MKIKEILQRMGLAISPEQLAELERQLDRNFCPMDRHQQEMEQLRFEHRLDSAIASAGARSAKAVRAMLDVEALHKSTTPDQDIEQALEQLRQDSGYLFESEPSAPLYAAGTGCAPLPAADTALRAAFGLGE